MDWKILESSVALAANLARDLLNTKISDEKEKQKVENFIEKNPVKAAEILPENTPIQNEAIQAIDGGTDAEVNNEVVDDFLEDTWKFNENDWKEDDSLPPLSKEEGEAALDEALTGLGFKEDIPEINEEEREEKEDGPTFNASLTEVNKPTFESADLSSIEEQTIYNPTVTTSDFKQPEYTESNANTSSFVTPKTTIAKGSTGGSSISSNLDENTIEEEKTSLPGDVQNKGSTFNDEESKPVALQHITNAPGAVVPTSTWAKPSETNGDFKVKSSDLPQMEGTKVLDEGIDVLPKADLALLENNIRKTPLNIFQPLKVRVNGDDILVDGTPLQDCSTSVLRKLMEKMNA